MSHIIEARGLHTHYGQSHILRGVDFLVGPAQTIGLMGRNGMGKTTLLKSLMGLVKPSGGTVQVKVGLRNVPPGMQLGAPVTATTNAQGRPSVELPWSALTKALHEPAVWVVGEGDKVELRKVEVTRYLTGKIVVASGLKSGETVVVSGGQLLHPNMQVHKVDAKDGGGAP